MSNIVKLSRLETEYILKSKGFLFSILAVIVYTLAIMFSWDNSHGFLKQISFRIYYSFYADIAYYIVITLAALSLSKEFAFKTSRIIFTSSLSRNQILITKMISLFIVSLFIALLHQVLGNILLIIADNTRSVAISIQSAINTACIYTIFTFFVGSFAFFITTLTYSRMWTLIIVILTFILERQIRAIIMIFRGDTYTNFLNQTPFAIATKAFQYNTLNFSGSIILFISSAFLFGVTAFILTKKEIA
ncbi:ABC transporter permease [Priestia megaterium]|uniref:ABC transporter permease n=1 Tax=Priestia megaterium TaxID=1404 RepID=UPI00077D8C4B|nr:ABC transporter permease [Priestia megaterium]